MLIYIITFAEMMRKIDADTHINFLDIIYLSFSQIPPIIDKIFPFLILLSSLWSILGLLKTSELIIFKTAGVSLWGISKIYFSAAFCVSVIYVFCIMPVFAVMHDTYREWENSQIQTIDNIHKKIILPNTQQVAFLTASKISLHNNTLENVYVTFLDSGNITEKIYFSPQATYNKDTQTIQLYQSDMLTINSKTPTLVHTNTVSLKVNLQKLIPPKQNLSGVYDYPDLIKTHQEQKLSVNSLVILFYSLLILPVTCGIYSFISMAFVPSLSRGYSYKLIGVVAMTLLLGVIFYILDNWIMTLSGNGKLPVLLAITTFKISIFFVCVIMIFNKEYGFQPKKIKS